MSDALVPRIHRIFISPGHDFKGRHGKGRLNHGSESVSEVECVAARGLRGDRYWDFKENFKGQVTFFDLAVATELKSVLEEGDFELSQFRRNVIVEGVDLNRWIGARFRIGEVEFEGVEECAPCYWMNESLGPGAEALMRGRGGLRCRIVCSGSLRVGPIGWKGVA